MTMPATITSERIDRGMQCRQLAGAFEQEQDFNADERAENENLAMGEVDELQNAVDHRVAQGDQSIHEAENDAVKQNLRKNFQCQFQVDAFTLGMLTNSFRPGYRQCDLSLATPISA